MAVLAIANRLGANQALGDMVERIARAQKVNGWSAGLFGTSYYTIDTAVLGLPPDRLVEFVGS
jgi:hypothetical protein